MKVTLKERFHSLFLGMPIIYAHVTNIKCVRSQVNLDFYLCRMVQVYYAHFDSNNNFATKSRTKFSIVIGSPGTCLSRNRRAITWVSNHRYPIWAFRNWIAEIRYPRNSHVNYARFNGFLHTVSHSFSKALQTFSLKENTQKTFLIPELVIDTIKITRAITPLIVSITKFSIVIGSPPPICHVIGARWRGCPIWTFSNRTPVIGYPRDFHVSYTRFNGFLSNVFYSFQFLEDIFNSEICYRYDELVFGPRVVQFRA